MAPSALSLHLLSVKASSANLGPDVFSLVLHHGLIHLCSFRSVSLGGGNVSSAPLLSSHCCSCAARCVFSSFAEAFLSLSAAAVAAGGSRLGLPARLSESPPVLSSPSAPLFQTLSNKSIFQNLLNEVYFLSFPFFYSSLSRPVSSLPVFYLFILF